MRPFAILAATAASALACAAGAARAQDIAAVLNVGLEEKAALATPAEDLGLNKAGPSGVAPVVHLEGFKPGQLKLSGPVLADIFLGNITRWDSPQIASLNPGTTLPHKPITVVHRSDRSDASAGFAGYLSAQSPTFRSEVGSGDTVRWPVGVGGDGDKGVAAKVQATDDAIGYVDYGFARKNGLDTARVIDGRHLPARAVGAPAPAPVQTDPAIAQALSALGRPSSVANFDKSDLPTNDAD